MISGTSTRINLPSIDVPPWAGGEPLRGAPLDVTGARHPPVDRSVAVKLAPTYASFIMAVCQKNHVRHRHFYQLFHQLLRLGELRALRGGVLDGLGQVDNLLDYRRHYGNDLQDVHRLVPHLRHRSIENLHEGADGVRMFRGVLQHRSCRRGSTTGAGRNPAVSSSNSSNNTASSLELTVFWLRGASCVSAPAPLDDEWCGAVVNTMRTVIRSGRSHERSRPSLLSLAAELPA